MPFRREEVMSDAPNSVTEYHEHEMRDKYPGVTPSGGADVTLRQPEKLRTSLIDAIAGVVVTVNDTVNEVTGASDVLKVILDPHPETITIAERLQALYKLHRVMADGQKNVAANIRCLDDPEDEAVLQEEEDEREIAHTVEEAQDSDSSDSSGSSGSNASDASDASEYESDDDFVTPNLADLSRDEVTFLREQEDVNQYLLANDPGRANRSATIPPGALTIDNTGHATFPVPPPILEVVRIQPTSLQATMIQLAQSRLMERFRAGSSEWPLRRTNEDQITTGDLVMRMVARMSSFSEIVWTASRMGAVVNMMIDAVSTRAIQNARAFVEKGDQDSMKHGSVVQGARTVEQLDQLQNYPPRFVNVCKKFRQAFDAVNATRYAYAKKLDHAIKAMVDYQWGMDLVDGTTSDAAMTAEDRRWKQWLLARIASMPQLPSAVLPRGSDTPELQEVELVRLKYTCLIGRILNPNLPDSGYASLSTVLGRWAAGAAVLHVHGIGLYPMFDPWMRDQNLHVILGIKTCFCLAEALGRLDYLFPACYMSEMKLMGPAVNDRALGKTQLSTGTAFFAEKRRHDPNLSRASRAPNLNNTIPQLVDMFVTGAADDVDEAAAYAEALELLDSEKVFVAKDLARVRENTVPRLGEPDELGVGNFPSRYNIARINQAILAERNAEKFFLKNASAVSRMAGNRAENVAVIKPVYILEDDSEHLGTSSASLPHNTAQTEGDTQAPSSDNMELDEESDEDTSSGADEESSH